MTRSRWVQLLLGLLCMIVIASPQYVWTLFTQPLMASLQTRLAVMSEMQPTLFSVDPPSAGALETLVEWGG